MIKFIVNRLTNYYPPENPLFRVVIFRSIVFPKAKGYPRNPQAIEESVLARMDRKLLQVYASFFYRVTELCMKNWKATGETIQHGKKLILCLKYFSPS